MLGIQNTYLVLFSLTGGTGQNNEAEEDDHEFFDAVEGETGSHDDEINSFVIKVPVSMITCP